MADRREITSTIRGIYQRGSRRPRDGLDHDSASAATNLTTVRMSAVATRSACSSTTRSRACCAITDAFELDLR